jgi:exodeoxyribonuclease VII large subunit
MNNERRIYSVNDLNEFVSSLLAQTQPLHNIWMKAEINGLKQMGKSWYFTLKDAQARMAGIFFTYGSNLPKFVKDGDSVLVFGKIALYPPTGTYQFVVSQFESMGEGDLLLKLKQLKEKLAKEGLFETSRKRDIPSFVTKVGVIAGKDSAAIKDVIHNIQRRFPLMEITFFPSLVQGPNAPASLIQALNRAYAYPIQVLILARGGGAEEDLSAFNDELVVRKVALSPMPTVAAIGHEINWSLVDLVADLRVSTPTAAAERVAMDYRDLLENVFMSNTLLKQKVTSLLKSYRDKLDSFQSRPWMKDPSLLYQRQRQLLENKREKMNLLMKHTMVQFNKRIEQQQSNLTMLHPKQVLKRGYAMVTNDSGNVIQSVKQIQAGMTITTQVSDGIIKSTIQKKDPNHE